MKQVLFLPAFGFSSTFIMCCTFTNMSLIEALLAGVVAGSGVALVQD